MGKPKERPEWRATDTPGRCVDCGRDAYLKDRQGRYRHKVCADQRKDQR